MTNIKVKNVSIVAIVSLGWSSIVSDIVVGGFGRYCVHSVISITHTEVRASVSSIILVINIASPPLNNHIEFSINSIFKMYKIMDREANAALSSPKILA